MKRLIVILLFFASISSAQTWKPHYPLTMRWNLSQTTNTYWWYAQAQMAMNWNADTNWAKNVRAWNSNIKLLCSADWNVGSEFGEVNQLPSVWAVKDSAGVNITPYGGAPFPNLSDSCPLYSGTITLFHGGTFAVGTAAGLPTGETFVQAFSRYWETYFVAHPNVWDGIQSDGMFPTPQSQGNAITNVDLNNDGRNDVTQWGAITTQLLWSRGFRRCIDSIRVKLGRHGIVPIITMNGSGSYDTNMQHGVNGWGDESPVVFAAPHSWNSTYPYKGSTDTTNDGRGATPRCDLWPYATYGDSCHHPGGEAGYNTSYRYIRWGIGLSLLGAYAVDIYGFRFNGTPFDYWSYDYDELHTNLGSPTGAYPYYHLINGSTGCYVAWYDSGCAIVNVGSATETIDSTHLKLTAGYAGPYYKFQGSQDPIWNSGEKFSSVVLKDSAFCATALAGYTVSHWTLGDAIVLLKAPHDTIIADIIVDDDVFGTTPGSQAAVFTGTWTPNTSNTTNVYATTIYTIGGHVFSHSVAAGNGSAYAIFTPNINITGYDSLFEWHSPAGTATNVKLYIAYHGGIDSSHTISQAVNRGQWNFIAKLQFDAGGTNYVKITNNANGTVSADAFRWKFATSVAGNAPSAFTPISPSNGAISQALSGTLSWGSASAALNYDVYLGTANPPTTIVSAAQVTTSYSYGPLSYGSTYYWKIVANNAYGSTTGTGMPYSFSTVAAPITSGKKLLQKRH